MCYYYAVPYLRLIAPDKIGNHRPQILPQLTHLLLILFYIFKNIRVQILWVTSAQRSNSCSRENCIVPVFREDRCLFTIDFKERTTVHQFSSMHFRHVCETKGSILPLTSLLIHLCDVFLSLSVVTCSVALSKVTKREWEQYWIRKPGHNGNTIPNHSTRRTNSHWLLVTLTDSLPQIRVGEWRRRLAKVSFVSGILLQIVVEIYNTKNNILIYREKRMTPSLVDKMTKPLFRHSYLNHVDNFTLSSVDVS